ncbi:MAG: DsbA family oxidoreductase [Pseudomonadota bacterium]
MSATQSQHVIQIDIVSDVVCPWCIVGFLHLRGALQQLDVPARLRWHPFELNPDMSSDAQLLSAHIAEKYGATPEQNRQTRARLATLGTELGFTFNFDAHSRIVNTFLVHQLLDWAETQGQQHPFKLAVFDAYFTQQHDVSDIDVLMAVADTLNLDTGAAHAALTSGRHATAVREKQRFWRDLGISGVPSMVFDRKYLLTGAQGTDTYAHILQRCLTEAA